MKKIFRIAIAVFLVLALSAAAVCFAMQKNDPVQPVVTETPANTAVDCCM